MMWLSAHLYSGQLYQAEYVNGIITFVFIHESYYTNTLTTTLVYSHSNKGMSNNVFLLLVALFTFQIKIPFQSFYIIILYYHKYYITQVLTVP